MENFIDYLMYALLGHNYTVRKNVPNCFGIVSWTIVIEERVYFILDALDLDLLRNIRNSRVLNDDEKARYDKLFSLCE